MFDNEVFKNGYEACLKNAELWLNEGKTLFKKESYGHACALYIHGLEGLIHAWWSWLVYIGAIKPDNKDFLSTFKDHDPKLRSFWGIYIGRHLQVHENDIAYKDNEGTWIALEKAIREFHRELTRLSRETLNLRNRAIYMHYFPKNIKFESPLDISKDEASHFIEVIRNVYEFILHFIRDSNEKEQDILRWLYQAMYKD